MSTKQSEGGADVDLVRLSGVLLLSSLALLTEGTTRFISNDPSTAYSELTTVQELSLVCAVFLVIIGFCGLVTGAALLVVTTNQLYVYSYLLS
jgi:hypothetical protein